VAIVAIACLLADLVCCCSLFLRVRYECRKAGLSGVSLGDVAVEVVAGLGGARHPSIFAEIFEDVGCGAPFPGLDRGPCAGDGGVERGAFGFVEVVVGVIDDEVELRPFGEVRRLVYDEAAVSNSSSNR